MIKAPITAIAMSNPNSSQLPKSSSPTTVTFQTRVCSDFPKMLAIFPDEKHYLTLNNASNDIAFYAVDYEKKYSIWEGKPIKVDKPNCIYILKL